MSADRGSRVDKYSDVVLRRSMGQNAPEMISNLVISDWVAATLELIANSHDADAECVEVEFNPNEDYLSISDDGDGMTPEGLQPFFWIGDSPKLEERVTSRGRRRIGKFGVATILLKFLGESYSLETMRDGLLTTVKETFDKDTDLDARAIIPWEPAEVDPSYKGTKITIRGLHYGKDSLKILADLKRRIRWELPLLPDFKVVLNSNPITQKSIDNATEFKVDKHGEHMGTITGSIFYTRSNSNMAGLHVYVNGRRVGDPASLANLSSLISLGHAKRIVGVINANGLEEAILFDRGRFRQDHPGYIELKETVEAALRKIRQYADTDTALKSRAALEARIHTILKSFPARFKSAGIEGITDDTTFVLSDELTTNETGFYDTENNRVVLNANTPNLRISTKTKPTTYEGLLLGAIVDVMALSSLNKKPAQQLLSFLGRRRELFDSLITSDESRQVKEIHPMAVYAASHLAGKNGKSIGTIRYLVRSGFLPIDTHGRILGQDFLDLGARTEGLIPLYQFLETRYGNAAGSHEDQYTRFLKRAGKVAEPFVKNFGDLLNPCFFLDEFCLPRLQKVFDADVSKTGRHNVEPADSFRVFHALHYTIPELAKFTGRGIKTVAETISYAKRESLQLRTTDGKAKKINYGDFIAAVQHRRKNQ